jgi:mevalonate kinase
MKDATAEAHGKIILFGEHSVVYGYPAIAMPLNAACSQARVKAGSSGGGVTLIARDLKKSFSYRGGETNQPLLKVIFLALQQMAIEPTPDIIIEVSSDIPIAGGLGSGAAVNTAIVRALSRYFERPLTPEEVSAIVFEAEKIYHGHPSGIDNTVIAYDQPIYFVKGDRIILLEPGADFAFLAADTGIASQTKQVVEDLRQRYEREPAVYSPLLAQAGRIAAQAREALEKGESSPLGELMNENHTLLSRLGVSHPTLDGLVQSALGAGALGAKMSGAGWGGNMIALVSPERIPAVRESLEQAGAARILATTLKSFKEK